MQELVTTANYNIDMKGFRIGDLVVHRNNLNQLLGSISKIDNSVGLITVGEGCFCGQFSPDDLFPVVKKTSLEQFCYFSYYF
jgi:hypothetical protein